MSTARIIVDRLHCIRLASEFIYCYYLYVCILSVEVALGETFIFPTQHVLHSKQL